MYELNKEDLKKLGLEPGKSAVLNFESGFTVAGKLVHAWHEEETLLLLTWKECRITRGNETYFRPEWGEFDMAVGEKILSVSGGPADREKYGEFDVGSASSTPGRTSPFSKKELTLFEAYSEVHRFRTAKQTPDFSRLDALVDKILREHPQEWLLQLELYELSASAPKAHWVKRTQENLQQLAKNEAAPTGDLIRKGMETLSKPKTSRNAS
jgi:phenylalanine-4-hydroxylase